MAIVVFEHSPLVNSGRLGEMLRNSGHRLDVRRLYDGDSVPVDLDNVDGVVSCGGEPSIVSNPPHWAEPEMDYLRAAHHADLPIVGLCLGCEMLAVALGGTVDRLSGGIELGWTTVCLTDLGKNDIIHTGIGWKTKQFHWHHDCVTRVPDGAQVLAISERCPVQSWVLGVRTYGFQYHPEVNRQDIVAWADDGPHDLEEAGISRDELLRQTDLSLPDMARVTSRLFEQIALLLMPVDRRFAGLHREDRY